MTIVLLVSSSSYLKAKRRTTTSNLPQSFSFVGREKKNEEAADKLNKKIKLLNYLVIKLAIPTRVGKSTREKHTPLPLL